MISFTPQQAIFYLILSPVALIVILMALVSFKRVVVRMLRLISHNKSYKIMMKKVEDMKKNGEFHVWVSLPVNQKESAYVCTKTGYCPTLGGFFDLKYVNKAIKKKEEKDLYVKFKKEKIIAIALNFKLTAEEVEEITNQIVSIPQQYAIDKLQKSENELKN